MFDDHAVKVMDKISKGKPAGRQCLAVEDLQKIIQKAAIQGGVRSTYKESDRGIERAASDAFGLIVKGQKDVQGLLTQPLQVNALVITSLNAASWDEAKGQAKEYAEVKAAAKARKSLEKELKAYAAKKGRDSATAVHKSSIQQIVDKHWKDMSEAFPHGAAVQATSDAVLATLGTYLGTDATAIAFDAGGKITTFPDLDTRIDASKDTRKQAVQSAEEKKIHGVHEVIKAQLAAYKAKLVASPDRKTDDAKVAKIVKDATSGLKPELKGDHKDGVVQGVQDMVKKELEAVASDVTFDGVAVTAVTWDTGKLQAERDGKADDAKGQKRKALITKLTAKVTKKVNSGAKKKKNEEVGVKWSVIHLLDKDLPKTATELATLDGLDKADDKIDRELEAAINEPIGGLFTVTVTGGRVDKQTWNSKADAAVYAEQHRKSEAKLKGGDEQDNARRRMVADAVRKQFASYSAEVRKAVAETAEGSTKVKITGVERAKLQEIIDKKLKSAWADVTSEVGDDALQDAAAFHFGLTDDQRSGPGAVLLKKFRTEGLKIAEFEAVPVSAAAKGRTSVAAEKKAQASLEALLREKVKDISGYTPSLTILNKVIEASGVGTIANINVDTVIMLAIGAVWSGELEELDVAGGAVTKFQPRRVEVTARGQ